MLSNEEFQENNENLKFVRTYNKMERRKEKTPSLVRARVEKYT